MVIPGMGVDPQKMLEMQKISQHINGAIRVDYKNSNMQVSFSSDNPEAAALIPQLLGQLSEALATQLSSFFAITGEITEVGK